MEDENKIFVLNKQNSWKASYGFNFTEKNMKNHKVVHGNILFEENIFKKKKGATVKGKYKVTFPWYYFNQ